MRDLTFWRLCTEYTINEAAMLIAGHNPEEAERFNENQWSRFENFYTVRNAMMNSIRAGRLQTVKTFTYQREFDDEEYIDATKTLLDREELKRWLNTRGFIAPFFDDDIQGAPSQAGSRFFAPKLHAANLAWSAVTNNPDLLRGKSPKAALQKWLTDHASELGLVNREGKPNTTGIQEICKVANWRPEGGATPTGVVAPTTLVRLPVSGTLPAPRRESFAADLDDEIPF